MRLRRAAPLLALALLAAAPAPEVMTLDGLGPLRIGTPADELRSRFRAVADEAPPDPEVDCAYWASPLFPGVQMMVSGGRLVRIETEDRRYRTPGGARVGLAEAEIRARYGARMRVEEHPYMGPEGKYLIVRAKRGPLGLIVETWDGRARSIRVGYWRSVRLIEGCS
ncbi:MAG TPA: hypothetical protein VFQ67_15965 [Allosphingosinicella sp.]|jgi:hypothetical protein|nr:hypothetical protein [Allosphingosinicella sp.]